MPLSFVETSKALQENAPKRLEKLIEADSINLAEYELVAQPADVTNPAALDQLPFLTVVDKGGICAVFDVVDQERILNIWRAETNPIYCETNRSRLPHFHVRPLMDHITLEQLCGLVDDIQRVKSEC